MGLGVNNCAGLILAASKISFAWSRLATGQIAHM
jgi:hypothetical protein